MAYISPYHAPLLSCVFHCVFIEIGEHADGSFMDWYHYKFTHDTHGPNPIEFHVYSDVETYRLKDRIRVTIEANGDCMFYVLQPGLGRFDRRAPSAWNRPYFDIRMFNTPGFQPNEKYNVNIELL